MTKMNNMKSVKKIVSAVLCLTLVLLSISFTAFAAEKKTVTVKSAQNLFEPFSRSVLTSEAFDVVIRLRSDLPIIDGTLELGFDSSCFKVTACQEGEKINALSNITEKRQTEYNNVISAFTAGSGFCDFSTEDKLISYTFTVTDEFIGDKEITVDFKNLIANRTYIKDDGTEDITVDGDQKLISGSAVVGENFSVRASIDPLKGDVNLDGEVNVNDVTELQIALTGSKTLSDVQQTVAEVYADGKNNIRDVTMIQLFLAALVEFL